MNHSILSHPNISTAKAVIASQEAAKEMGQWDATHGNRCDPDAYAYSHEWNTPYWRSDYTYAYIQAKGL